LQRYGPFRETSIAPVNSETTAWRLTHDAAALSVQFEPVVTPGLRQYVGYKGARAFLGLWRELARGAVPGTVGAPGSEIHLGQGPEGRWFREPRHSTVSPRGSTGVGRQHERSLARALVVQSHAQAFRALQALVIPEHDEQMSAHAPG